MVISFFVAFLLAWPTKGISLVIYAIIIAIKIYFDGRSMKFEIYEKKATMAVNSNLSRLPQWFENEAKLEEFTDGVIEVARTKGIPAAFSKALFNDQSNKLLLFHFAGAMESEGASFLEQQVGVTNKVVESYIHYKS